MQPIPPQLLVCKYLAGKSFTEVKTPGRFGTIKTVFKERNDEPCLSYEVFDQKSGSKDRDDSALLFDFFRYLHAKKLKIVNVIGNK